MIAGRLAGSNVGKYNAESSKQGSKRLNFITKTSHFAHLDMLFIYDSNSIFALQRNCFLLCKVENSSKIRTRYSRTTVEQGRKGAPKSRHVFKVGDKKAQFTVGSFF